MIDLASIPRRLAGYEGDTFVAEAQTRQAAVAVVLREFRNGTEVLFIKRASSPATPGPDRWRFPGGHRDSTDSDLKEAAMRETLEEVGLDLAHGDYLGALDHHWAAPRGPRLRYADRAARFEIAGDPGLKPNYEVDEVVWAPLAPMLGNELHDTQTLSITGSPTVFNGYRLAGGHFVWGLTYRMLKDSSAPSTHTGRRSTGIEGGASAVATQQTLSSLRGCPGFLFPRQPARFVPGHDQRRRYKILQHLRASETRCWQRESSPSAVTSQ